MRKKKQMEIYKRGMEAGAAPFEKKYEETAKPATESCQLLSRHHWSAT